MVGWVRRAMRAVRFWRGVAALLIVIAICVAGWPLTKARLQAVAVLRMVSGQPVPWVLKGIVTEPVRTEDVQIETAAGMVRGRVYVPVRHPDAQGMVVLHGVHYLGMNEPRLMVFAEAMAGCGLRVLTPELPGIKDYHIDAGSVKVIGGAAKWFAKETGGPVGVMGLSFSGGLALVAAADPAYRDDFKFVVAVGAQDAMEHVESFYLTGQEVRPDGSVERLKPHEYGSLVLEYEHLEDFVQAGDEAAIRTVLREHLYEDKNAEGVAAARLTAAQRAEAAELLDAESAVTRAKLAAAATKHVREMAGVSPAGVLGTMTTPVYLLHGQADNIIPSAETLWMASELPGSTLKAELVSPVLSHLDVAGDKPGLWDQWRLLHFFALVMRAAEKN
jgi:pimeloyl-ACP methyl ester carboxylesterase